MAAAGALAIAQIASTALAAASTIYAAVSARSFSSISNRS